MRNGAGGTALQMDIKIAGITAQLMRQALGSARGAFAYPRCLRAALAAPREQSRRLPRVSILKIKRIRSARSSTRRKSLRDIVPHCGVKMDVQDDGTVTIAPAMRPRKESH